MVRSNKAIHARVITDIVGERERQDAKWGVQDHDPMQWLSILGEEVGEVCKAANEAEWGGKGLDEYRQELIQVAAVAMAAVENLDRRRAKLCPCPWCIMEIQFDGTMCSICSTAGCTPETSRCHLTVPAFNEGSTL